MSLQLIYDYLDVGKRHCRVRPASYDYLDVGKRHCRVPTINLRLFGCRETALPIGVNLSLKALVSLAFSRVYNPLNPPW